MKQYIIIVAVVALLGLIYFGLAGTGSVITLRSSGIDIPVETGTFNFAERIGEYETVKLDCVTSGDVVISEENDGETSFCNHLNSGSKLNLISELKFTGTGNKERINYIETKIKLPAGKYVVDYGYDVSDYYPSSAYVKLNINGHIEKFVTSGTGKVHQIDGTGTYEFETKTEQEVTFRIDTGIQSKLSESIGFLDIEFTPSEVQTQHDVTPNTNADQIKPVQLNFIDRINAWIQNFFNKIFGGSK